MSSDQGQRTRQPSTGAYETLESDHQVRECNLMPWESLFLQFRDPGAGEWDHRAYAHLRDVLIHV